MIDFKLDPRTGDLDLSTLDVQLLGGAERVRQQLYIKLNLWVGEWFLDLEFGTPWLEEILGKEGVSISTARAALIDSALEVDGVDDITDFRYDFDTSARKLTVEMDASTSYGIITVSTIYGDR